jgi:two-component system chemotaxis response regulator CheB
VIGCSWGGFDALTHVLGALPGDFPLPIVIVQHRGTDASGDGLAASLASCTELPVRDVDDKDEIEPGVVYLAPADYHLAVTRRGFELSVDEPVRFSRPSIDVLFDSAADEYREGVVAVLLTGANQDGTEGLRRVRAAGGLTIVQDPATAERPEMPAAAVRAGVADRVLPLDAIAVELAGLGGVASRRRTAS